MNILLVIGLALACLLTSIFSAVFGVAGGMMLFVVLSILLDVTIALPLHAAAQSVSNIARVAIATEHLEWPVIWRYSLLIIPGAYLGSLLYAYLSPDWLEIGMGVTILIFTLKPLESAEKNGVHYPTFIVLGFVSGFLGMIIGVVGPLISPFFSRNGISKERMVATKAACQAIVQLVKIPTFGLVIKFNYQEYLWPMVTICIVTIFGTWVGKKLITRIPDHHYHRWEKAILCVLSLILIGKAAYKLTI